ncbi:Coatomer subunit delta-like protein [Drosera capensis]
MFKTQNGAKTHTIDSFHWATLNTQRHPSYITNSPITNRSPIPIDTSSIQPLKVLGVAALLIGGVNCSQDVIVSRQFVDMTRYRIEGLLAAFPKLVGTGKQHTFVEAENVRYVYQPIETLFLLVVTNKQSNILEDLETLRLLSKLVPEYAMGLDEEGIGKAAFELIFAFDEVISLGHRENVTVAQVKQYCEMESHEEKLHKLVIESKMHDVKEVMKRKANEIDRSKIEKTRGDKGGFMSLQSMGSGRIESSLSDIAISGSSSGGFGGGSGFGLTSDVDSYSTKPKGRPPSAATAPPKGSGMQLGKMQKSNPLLESLKAEGEVIVDAVQPASLKSKSAAPPPTDPITLTVEEKINVSLRRDGALSSFDVQGQLSLQILEEKDAYIQVQVESGGNPGILFKTHPNINKELFASENILGLKDPNRPFPIGQLGDGVGLLKWRMQGADESALPLTINCWPSVSGNDTYVNIEYEASSVFDLRNVVISVPLPALRDAPNVRQIDGEWRYDSRNSILEWSVVLIDNSNRSGAMEFIVPATDPSNFYPISVRFSANSTFSDLKVVNVLPLKQGPTPKYTQRILLQTENYQVV